ncbi:MAG: hypothetical protein IJ925_04435 [Muribaculaceae bacterium]|nr:hypothetical protein [Muribaculaceae bacterium]
MKKLILALIALMPVIAVAEDVAPVETEKKSLSVSVSTLSTSDSAIMATKPQDGEKPVQPLNIHIGPSKLTLFGYAQTQFDMTKTGPETKNSFSMTRIILMANAELTRKLSFFLMIDAASTQAAKHLHEYYAQYAFMPELKVRVGQFKTPYTLENIISPTLLGNVNINEGTRYMSGIAGDPLYGNYAGRDLGAMITGDAIKARDGHYYLNYSVGVFNGAGMNLRDNNKHKDVAAMLNVLPTKDITLSGSFIVGKGNAQVSDMFGTIAQGENYTRNRWSVGAEVNWRPLKLRTEYMGGKNGPVKNRAFYAELWCRLYRGLDLVLDYDYLDKNTALSKEARDAFPLWTRTNNYLVGLQYWVYKKCRISTQYVFSDRNTGPDTKAWITQFQIAF